MTKSVSLRAYRSGRVPRRNMSLQARRVDCGWMGELWVGGWKCGPTEKTWPPAVSVHDSFGPAN